MNIPAMKRPSADRQTSAGSLFTKKALSYGYRDPQYKPKTVWRPSQVL